jgi:hypothetical protein
MVADRYLSIAREAWAFVLLALGVGAAWLADFNAFNLWGTDVRADWIGVTLTGAMIGGLGLVCRGLGHLAGELTRMMTDEADTIEKEKGLKRVA